MSDRETITCPCCKATIRLSIDYDVDATVDVESHDSPPEAVEVGGHPSDTWTAKALDAIPVVATKVPT